MIISLPLTACAAEEKTETGKTVVLKIGEADMTVDGKKMPIDEEGTAPVIKNGRTLLPVRAVVEELGGTVAWNGEKREVTLTCGEDEIRLTIDSPEALLNGEKQTLDSAPEIMNGRTMLPIRFIAEGFGFGVEWNEEEKSVTVTSIKAAENEPAKQPEETAKKSLVVYFSATGNTKALAEKIAEVTGSDIAEIVPKEPYTADDIDYSNDGCRANREQNDEAARPEIANAVDIKDYDTVFIGYPIWWGTMPKIINTFLESYDFSGKTVMPFCTSGGSGIGTSVSAIKEACPNAEVKEGFRGTSAASDTQIRSWLSENGFEKSTAEGNTSAVVSRIRLVWGNHEAVIALENNKTAEDLVSKLPMKVKIEDYNNTEKISRFSDEIYKDTAAAGIRPSAGDVALYAPWGNLAVFYKDSGYSDDLIPIGRVESGLSELTAESGDFEVTIEPLN